jgi:hypothetical protein
VHVKRGTIRIRFRTKERSDPRPDPTKKLGIIVDEIRNTVSNCSGGEIFFVAKTHVQYVKGEE